MCKEETLKQAAAAEAATATSVEKVERKKSEKSFGESVLFDYEW